jgi:hypothetical protein
MALETDGWVDGWVGVKAVLRIAYNNQKLKYYVQFQFKSHFIDCPHVV